MDALAERNPRVVSAVKLHRAAARRKAGRFLAEGANAVMAAIAADRAIELFHTADADPAVLHYARSAGVPVALVTDKAARALGDTVAPPGIVAVCRTVDVPLARVTGARLLAVPVEIADPGNAGTVIRVADAVGADAVVLAGDAVDPHNGKCVRASAGSLFHLPIVRERGVETVLDELSRAGIQLLATSADGELSLDESDGLLDEPTAWLFGNEARGLDPEVVARADHRVRIPIRGRAESLNLATAAAICLYASARVQAAKSR